MHTRNNGCFFAWPPSFTRQGSASYCYGSVHD
jgi:hypothetical protein